MDTIHVVEEKAKGDSKFFFGTLCFREKMQMSEIFNIVYEVRYNYINSIHARFQQNMRSWGHGSIF